MSATRRSVWGLKETLDMDRARYRRARNRVIRSEHQLIEALEDWQGEADQPHRGTALRWARRMAKEVRSNRKFLAGISATLRGSEERYREAMAAERAMENAG